MQHIHDITCMFAVVLAGFRASHVHSHASAAARWVTKSPAHGHKRGLHRTDLLSFNLRVQGHGMRGCTLPGIISP